MRRPVLLVAAAALATATGLAAQETGSIIKRYTPAEIPDNASMTPEQRAQVVMNAFAACVVQRSRRTAERLAATAPGSPEEGKLVVSSATPDCLGEGQLRFQPVLMRGGVFEALYRSDYAKAAPTGVPERAAIQYGGYASDLLSPDRQQRVALLQFADCVTRKDPAAVRALLFSRVASRREDAALADLQPALGGCLTAGRTLRFTRTTVRGMLAETLYRLSRAPASSTAPASGTNS